VESGTSLLYFARHHRQIYSFSPEKNKKLIEERSISFEEIIAALNNGNLLEVIRHQQYFHQEIYIVRIGRYAYSVPFVQQDKERVFFKNYLSQPKINKEIFIRKEDLI